MPIVPEATLKSYFEDGKEPDEGKYINFIDSILLADGTRIVSGDFTVGDGTGSRYINIDGAAGAWRGLAYQTGGVNRWIVRATNAAETGGNQGTDFEITSRTATGAWLGTPFKIWRATGTIKLSGADIYTVPLTAYDPTVVGWISYTHAKVYYKKAGKLVFVNFYIDGISDDTVATFTLPYTSKNITDYYASDVMRGMNNGTMLVTPGFFELGPNSDLVKCYTTQAGGAWINQNRKLVIGQFFYEAA